MKNLESTIKKKLEKLGLDTMDRPIEVKVSSRDYLEIIKL